MAERCIHCSGPPHQALVLRCTQPNCRILVCGTNAYRGHCINQFLIRREATAQWNSNLSRLELCDCPCGGTIIWVEVDSELRAYYNNQRRRCDLNALRISCSFFGNHSEIERHRIRNLDHYSIEIGEDDPPFQINASSFNRDGDPLCCFCGNVPHEAVRLVCGNPACFTLCCANGSLRSNCVNNILQRSQYVMLDTVQESLQLTLCGNAGCQRRWISSLEKPLEQYVQRLNDYYRTCDYNGSGGGVCHFSGTSVQIIDHINREHLGEGCSGCGGDDEDGGD